MAPRYNHTRGDSALTPCPVCRIHSILDGIGLTHAGCIGDAKRWSPGDLATDLSTLLAPYLTGAVEGPDKRKDLLDYLIDIASNTQGSEVWRALFAQLRRQVEKEAEA